MTRFVRLLIAPFKWLWSLQDPSLGTEEDVLFEGIAAVQRGILVPGGRLILTSERLIFAPSRFVFWPPRLWPAPFAVQLSAVESVELGDSLAAFFGGVPGVPQFAVHLKSGDTLKFQTLNAKAWQRTITVRLGEP